MGWKRGELFEVAGAILRLDFSGVAEEWGDCGYYVAQLWWWLWALYCLVTPRFIVLRAVEKFERRA